MAKVQDLQSSNSPVFCYDFCGSPTQACDTRVRRAKSWTGAETSWIFLQWPFMGKTHAVDPCQQRL